MARDGVEALDYLFGTGSYAGRDTGVMPTVILLDLKLPKMDGLEVLRRLRADNRTKLLPASQDPSDRGNSPSPGPSPAGPRVGKAIIFGMLFALVFSCYLH